MGRTIATTTAATSLWGSVETAVRHAISNLRAPVARDTSLAMLDDEQSRIRQTGRHWLVG